MPNHHVVLGQRTGLVGANDRRGAERLDRGQVTDEDVALCHALGGQHERQGQRREQPFRHHGDDDADRENEGLPERDADHPAEREEQETDQHREDCGQAA